MRMTCGPAAFKGRMSLTHRPGTKPLKFGPHVTPAAGLVVLPQYELVPKLEFVSYYYQLVLVRHTCISHMRFWWFVHYASTCGAFWILTCGKIWWNVRLGKFD